MTPLAKTKRKANQSNWNIPLPYDTRTYAACTASPPMSVGTSAIFTGVGSVEELLTSALFAGAPVSPALEVWGWGANHWGSCHGPASDNSQPPSQRHSPPNLLGRFSLGICFNSSAWYDEPRIEIFETVTGSSQRLTMVHTVEKPHGALIRKNLPILVNSLLYIMKGSDVPIRSG